MGLTMSNKNDSEISDLWFGWTGKKRFISNFGRKCEKALYTVSEYVGVLLVTVVATQIRWIFKDDIEITKTDLLHYTLIIIGLFLLGYGRIYKGKDFKNLLIEKEKLEDAAKKARSLSEEIVKAKQNYSELHSKFLRNWLKASMYALKMDTASYRVTIYAYTEEKKFLYLSRYSKNSSYNELHSIEFSPNQGVISKAWNHGTHIDIKDCPIYHSDPTGYIKYIHEVYGYSHEKISSLTMKSCQYVAFTVNDEQGPIAVIVFENDCLIKESISSQKVGQIINYCDTHNSQLVSYIREGIKCNTLGVKKSSSDSKQVSKVEQEILKALGINKGEQS